MTLWERIFLGCMVLLLGIGIGGLMKMYCMMAEVEEEHRRLTEEQAALQRDHTRLLDDVYRLEDLANRISNRYRWLQDQLSLGVD